MAYKYDPILCMMVEKPNIKTNDKAGEMWYLYVDGKSITAFESWGAPVKEAKEYMKKNNIKGVGTLKRIGRGGSFTITAKDEKKTFIVNIYVDGKNVKFASSAMSANGAILEARKKYPQGLVWGVDRATAKDADVLKKGQVYRNANGVEVEIISVEPGYVFVDFGGQKKDFTPYGLQKILSDNGYKKVRDAKVKDVDKYAEKVIELLKQGKTKNEVIFALQRMGLTPVDASQKLGKALVETGFKYNDSGSAVDEAIKAADKFTVWESDEYDDIYVSYEGGTYVLYVDGRPQADGPQQRMIQLAKQEERMRG